VVFGLGTLNAIRTRVLHFKALTNEKHMLFSKAGGYLGVDLVKYEAELNNETDLD